MSPNLELQPMSKGLLLGSPTSNTSWHLATNLSQERETTGLYPGFIHPLEAFEVDTKQKGLAHTGKNYNAFQQQYQLY